MRTQRLGILSATVLCIGLAHAQNDGDHCVTNPGGQTYMATDLQVPVPPVNMTIGTAPGLGATLRVRGDQLPVNDVAPLQAGMLCTFRTDVASAIPQSWRMYRDVNQIGAIWNENNHRAWHVQSLEQRSDFEDRYSGLMLQNEDGDGFWVMNSGTPTGGRAFPNALQLLDAKGYAALGFLSSSFAPGAGNPRGPWSRFHLFHNETGANTPWFAYRPLMRNGMTMLSCAAGGPSSPHVQRNRLPHHRRQALHAR